MLCQLIHKKTWTVVERRCREDMKSLKDFRQGDNNDFKSTSTSRVWRQRIIYVDDPTPIQCLEMIGFSIMKPWHYIIKIDN